MPGKWLDLSLYTRQKPGGTDTTHAIPPGAEHGSEPAAPARGEAQGPAVLYWGCSPSVRPGQPRILDMATAGPQAFARFFVGRYAPERGATSRPGHAIWPNEKDNQRVPKNASLLGEHAVSGEGVSPGLKFALGERHDFMERLNLAAPGDPKASINATWNALTHARAYFLSAMGGDGNDMVLWSSSDVPEAGLGLMDYLSSCMVP